jgi:hypothetical protein
MSSRGVRRDSRQAELHQTTVGGPLVRGRVLVSDGISADDQKRK